MSMRVLGRIAGVLLFITAVPLLAALVFWGLAGQFRDVQTKGAYTCVKVGGILGGEDIAIDRIGRWAYISADDRRAALFGRIGRGRLYRMEAFNDYSRPEDITPTNVPVEFHPTGVSLYTDELGSRRLFVINAPREGAQVLIFAIDRSGDLALVESISLDGIQLPNDLVAVGPRQFYLTSASETLDRNTLLLQLLGLRRTGSIAYFDGNKLSTMVNALGFANGIALSPDGRYLYVSETLAGHVAVYRRAPDHGLTFVRYADVPFAPDNIDVAPDGSLFVAGHPHLVDLLHYMTHSDGIAPSAVAKVTPATGGDRVRPLFIDSGQSIAASSVAALAQEDPDIPRLLVGSLADDHLALCRWQPDMKGLARP